MSKHSSLAASRNLSAIPTVKRNNHNNFAPKVLALAIAQLLSSPASAGLITVNDAGDAGGPSVCTLRQAIASANTDSAGGSACSAGSGPDIIRFSADVIEIGTITLSNATAVTTTDNVYINAPPLTPIVVDGANNSGVFVAEADQTTFRNLIITGGSAAEGAGISVFGNRSVTLYNTTISGNTASSFGGGIAGRYNSKLTLNNSVVSGNSAGILGGGTFAITGASLELHNSTVSGNSSGTRGGGVWVQQSDASIRHSTISDNTSGSGGGIYLYDSSFNIRNSVVAGNVAGSGVGHEVIRGQFDTTSSIDASYNVLGDNRHSSAQAFENISFGGTNIIATTDGTDPTALASILEPLSNNGGPTATHALVDGSPAIDASFSLDCTQSPTVSRDQRGFPRNSVCDSGAFEKQTSATITVTSASGGTGSCTLRDAIESSNDDQTVGGCAAGSNNDTIIFDPSVFPTDGSTTITLFSALPALTSHTTISGPGVDQLVINANGAARGLELNNAYVTLNNLTLTGGSSGYGGGIVAYRSSLYLHDARVFGNSSNLVGGVYLRSDSSLNLRNVDISQNTASSFGGGLAIRTNSKATIQNSTISRNISSSSTLRGGGVYVSGSSVELSNSTISGNSSSNEGAGISLYDGHASIANVTITNNYSTERAGGILLRSGSMNLTNSIVAGNTAGINSEEVFKGSGTFTTAFNVLGESSNTNSNAFFSGFVPDLSDLVATSDGTNPTELLSILLPLTNNGGLTETHALPNTSLAIDAGNDAICAAAPINNLDQRGERRPEGSSCDIGAFEAESNQIFVVPIPGGKTVIFSL